MVVFLGVFGFFCRVCLRFVIFWIGEVEFYRIEGFVILIVIKNFIFKIEYNGFYGFNVYSIV